MIEERNKYGVFEQATVNVSKECKTRRKCVIVEELTSTMHVEADVTYTTMNDVRQDKGDSVWK